MSVDRPRHKNTIWEIKIETRKAVEAPIAKDLGAFEGHKNALIANLRKVHKSRRKSKPFDAAMVWRDITRLARFYFWGAIVRSETMSPADRVKRLSALATASGSTRLMAERAMQNDDGNDLFRAWFAGTGLEVASVLLRDDGLSVLHRIAEDIKNMVASLATLEAAARKAASDLHPKRGRPDGDKILPPDYINALADVYQKSTGTKPSTGDGPFARFVREFLDAIGHKDRISERHMLEMIEEAFKRLKPVRPSRLDN